MLHVQIKGVGLGHELYIIKKKKKVMNFIHFFSQNFVPKYEALKDINIIEHLNIQ